jgi:hypothetical protein
MMKTRLLNMAISALIFISFAFPSALVHAASSGRIFGQLLDGTHNNAPIVGQNVTLQMAQGNNAHDLASVKTDARGSFAFNGLDTDKTINYAVYTRYQGAQYSSDLIDLSTKSLQQIDLTLYEATTSTASIAIVQATALLHKPDAQGGVLSISEVLFFKNVGTYTYVGSLDASKGKPDALLFALPPNARNISLSKGFDGYQVIQVDRGFATNAALPPGTSQFIFSFELPYTASNYDFSYDVVYPTVQFSLLVPPDVNVTASALTSGGLITADQHPYRLYQARDLLAGTNLQAQLQGLPALQSTATPTSNIWLIVVLLLMLAVLAVTWFIYRFARRPMRTRQSWHSSRLRIDPARTDVAPEAVAGGSTGNEITRSQQQALLQEILDLDKAYEAGKLKKSAYQEQRAKTKARLRALIIEEEAHSASASAAKKTTRGGKEES